MRGIRGATTVERNEKEEIWQAAQELVRALVDANGIAPEDIGAAIFSRGSHRGIPVDRRAPPPGI